MYADMKVVLFDLGNVLIDNHFDRFYGMMSESCGCSVAQLQKELEGEIMIQLETGKISMDEYIAHCKREFKLDWERDTWSERYRSTFSVNPEGSKIRNHLLAQGVPVTILSNLAEYHMLAEAAEKEGARLSQWVRRVVFERIGNQGTK